MSNLPSTAPIELDAVFPAQDFVKIGAQKSPGKAIVQNVRTPRPWDVRKGYGTIGATVVPMGDDVATFEIRFKLWDPAQIPAWNAFAATFFDKSVRFVPGSAQPKALSISHPQLSAPPVRVTSCVVTDATDLHPTLPDEPDGVWECVVYFMQYRKPKPALSPPDASIPAAATPTPTAEDAADTVIQAKSAQLAGLAKAQGLL